MSKLSFRARALDPSKQMPIYLAEELPDLPEYSAINRAVPQMPSGMEKEEESEHHLQRAICTGLIIPTPEVFTTDKEFYDNSYPPNYKMPRQLIHMQPLGLDNDVPEYDMDSSDECWVKQQSQRLDLTPLKFEQMMNRLERSSGQTVVTLTEAKTLLKQNDEVSIAVYDYWLNKRLKTQHPLILAVKTENRPGVSSNNPYLAFRRRTEKMQTRKNRKNDETSYEKMLKLRRDLQRATTMLEMVKKREKTKKEQLRLSIEIFEKRVELRDFNGTLFNELCATLKSIRPAFAPLYSNQYSHNSSSTGIMQGVGASVSTTNVLGGGALQQNFLSGCNSSSTNSGNIYTTSQYLNTPATGMDANIATGGSISRKEKRQYKKRKHKLQREKQKQPQQYSPGVSANATLEPSSVSSSYPISALTGLQHAHRISSPIGNESNVETEEDDTPSGGSHPTSKFESDYEEEMPFSFRRKQNCNYLKPLVDSGSWPWDGNGKKDITDLKYRFTLTSLRKPRPRCIGFARRRVGRGGRIILDRVSTDLDALWAELDYTILETGCSSDVTNEVIKSGSSDNVLTNTTKADKITSNTIGNKTIKSENNSKYDARLDLRNEFYYENPYVSELTMIDRNQISTNYHGRKNSETCREEFINNNKYKNVHNDNDLSNNLPRAHILKMSQTLKRAGLSNVLLNGSTDKDDNLLNSLEKNNITGYSSDIVGLNNNNIHNNLNKNVSLVDKINVIKCEEEQTSENVSVSIKEELIDSPQHGVIEDSNGGFSSSYKSVTNTDICYDEENVNLAQLSNLMRHTIKKELPEAESSSLSKDEPLHKLNEDLPEAKLNNNIENNVSFFEASCESLSPTSSLRLEACNDLLTEIRNDWLHFRPKTPSNELSDEEEKIYSRNVDEPIVQWSPNTPISVEIVNVSKSKRDNYLWNNKQDDDVFLTNSFQYSDIEPDSGILKSYYPIDDVAGKTKSTEYSTAVANKSMDLNISGDSLNDINLLADTDESDEHMLDNILQECQIDENKTLSQATNFWNGILDGEGAVDGADIENTEKLLGDDRKLKNDKYNVKYKSNKLLNQGSTTFSVVPILEINESDFFKKKSLKPELIQQTDEVTEVKEDCLDTKSVKLDNILNKENAECPKPITNFEDNSKVTAEDVAKTLTGQQNAQQLPVRQITVQSQQIQRQQVLLQMQRDLVPTSTNAQYSGTASTNLNTSATIRQPTLTPIRTASANNHVIYTTCSGDVFPVSHKVAYIQKAQNLNQNTVIALSNIKLENDGTQTATVISQPNVNNMMAIDSNQGLSGAQNINIISGASVSGASLTTSTPLIVTSAGRSPHFTTQQVQGQISQPQIVWRQISAAPNTTPNTTLNSTSADPIPANKIVWTSRNSQKRHVNGPENADLNRLLLNKKLSQRKVISQQSQQIHITKQHLQQLQRDNETTAVTTQSLSMSETASGDTLTNPTQKVQMHGKLIKIPSLLVSELQQKPNSLTIASSHNYNLPTSTMLSSQQIQAGNKIVLSGTGATSCNTLTGDAQTSCNSGQISVNTAQKVHYKDLSTNPSMKLNFVSNATAGSITQANLVLDTTKGVSTSHQSPTVLLNKSATNLQQQKLKPGSNIDNSKRVLYTSLLNVKNLQKTPSGQVQMQIGTGGMTHAVLRGRIANNQTIFTTNMRTVPIGTSISSSSVTQPQTQTLGTIVSNPTTTNNITQEQLSKGDSPHSTKLKEIPKNSTDQQTTNCNSNSIINSINNTTNSNNNSNSNSTISAAAAATIGNLKLGNSVIISAANTSNKNTIVTSTTNR